MFVGLFSFVLIGRSDCELLKIKCCLCPMSYMKKYSTFKKKNATSAIQMIVSPDVLVRGFKMFKQHYIFYKYKVKIAYNDEFLNHSLHF